MLLTLGTRDDHLAVLEDQGSCTSRVLETHDQRGETSRIILSITAMVADLLQIELRAQIRSRNQILDARRLILRHMLVAIRVSRWRRHARHN